MILLLTYTGILHFFQVYALPLPLTTEKSYERIVLTNASNDNGKTVLEEQPYDCHLILSTQDTIDAKQTFQQELLMDDNVFAFYIYLSKPKNITKASLGEYIANDEDGNKWNGLQEWFWVKKSMRYYTLNLPIDLDALTFQISKYGTKNIDIGWTLSTNCQKDNKIEYKNETELILNYIWTNVIGNQTDSYICHRNFENDIGYLELIWKITSIWVGYDFDCYEVNSLKEGIMENELISKNDLTKVLAFAVCFLGFMHPFIWYIFESIQVRKECDIFTYYKDVIDSEKPYGLVRCMRKCLYPGKGKTETENTEATDDQTTASTSDKTENTLLNTSIQAEDDPSVSNTAITSDITENTLLKTPNLAGDDPAASNTAPTNDTTTLIEETNNDKSSDMTKYAPIFRFFIVITCFILSMHLYKLNDMKHEMFKHNGYSDFPNVYRFGIPFYKTKTFNPWLIYFYIILSAVTYCISNSWVYTLYNDTEDFIICIPYDIFNGRYVIPMKTFTSSLKEKNDLYSFRASQKLIFRFTMIFSIRFWRFIFTYSMCGSSLCCLKKDIWYKCMFYAFYKIFCGPLLVAINFLINVIFCSLPALWFIIFIPLRKAGYGSKTDTKSKSKCTCSLTCLKICCPIFFKSLCSYNIFLLILYILYLFTLRQQVAFFIFIVRCCFYTIIVGFTGPDRVWRVYITVVASLTYFLSYVNEFVNSYKVLLKSIFRISKKDELDEKEFNYILDRCYSVQKRLFFLVVKTILTIVFLSVTFLILRETGKFDNSKYLNDFVSYLMILISPKIVSIFSQSSPEEDVQKHENEIPKLREEFKEPSKDKNQKEYTGDYCWQKIKYPCEYFGKNELCSKCSKFVSCKSCSKCCQVLKAVFCQFYLSTDHSEILSLDDAINKFEASSTCCTCCKRNENNVTDTVNDPVIPNNTDTGDSNQHKDYGSLQNKNPT